MQSLRKYLKYIFPVLVTLMIGALIMSRVQRPSAPTSEPEIRINANQAKNHIGTIAEVCGEVASARYLPQIGGKPTFLNFGKPSPNQTFTAVIWGENRPKWTNPPEQQYLKSEICVSGKIESHEGTPQIIVTHPEQIELDL